MYLATYKKQTLKASVALMFEWLDVSPPTDRNTWVDIDNSRLSTNGPYEALYEFLSKSECVTCGWSANALSLSSAVVD